MQPLFWLEFLDLTFDDVGERIELIYTPVRDDGIKGKPVSLISTPIAPGRFTLQDRIVPLSVKIFVFWQVFCKFFLVNISYQMAILL